MNPVASNASAERASQTAAVMALFRALESARSTRERLFTDPLAKRCLRVWGRELVDLARVPPAHRLIERVIDRQWPGARTSAVARTCLIDDAVSAAIKGGIRQVLLLGAGFDSRAYRLAGMNDVRVFEVDRAAIQREKIRLVTRWVRSSVAHVRYIALDLGEALSTALRANAFDTDARTFVLWEGVTNYLSASSVDATFRAIATSVGSRSQILFTYVHAGLLDASVRFIGGEEILRRVRDAGEPWTFGWDPAQLAAYLSARGFTLVEDVSADEYRARYFGDAARQMSGYSFYRVARALTVQ